MNRRGSPIWIGSDVLLGYAALAEERGFSGELYLARHGVRATRLADGREVIPLIGFADLLEDIAVSERCGDFGFRLAKTQAPLRSGPIGQLLLACPTVGEALRRFISFQHLYSESVRWTLLAENAVWFMRRFDGTESFRAKPQMILYSLTLGITAIRSIAGPAWKPLGVYFDNDHFDHLSAIRRLFDAPVFVNAGLNAIALTQSDLDLPIASHNPTLLDVLTRYFEGLSRTGRTSTPFANRVRDLIRVNLDEKHCSVERIARALDIHPRSLQRALAKERVSFRELLADTRLDVADHLLTNTKMSVSGISEILGYANTSAFSRAFSKARGCSPSQRRATDTLPDDTVAAR